ncbi:unnamed protein product, partial [Diamesa serratosioi]
LTKLTFLSLSDNLITEVPVGIFKDLQNLKTLKLNGNQLKSLHDFAGMENLEELNLYNNKLTSVPIDVFSTLPKLKVIGLGGNQIEEIPNGVFSNNLQLERIFLYENKIKFLGSSVFDGLTELNYVSLLWNVCIDKNYEGSSGINQLKKDIKRIQ